MGIEPYVVRSGLRVIVAQRLVRTLCACAETSNRPEDLLGLPVRSARVSRGCDSCRGSGYAGRSVLAELLLPDTDDLGRAILARVDVRRLESIAAESGMIDRWSRAIAAVEAGATSPAEVRRVLGVGKVFSPRPQHGHRPQGD
jgi:type II secretory ATPase GspE/PulE/Tfp pilus assembly ATPase PilB-like protein